MKNRWRTALILSAAAIMLLANLGCSNGSDTAAQADEELWWHRSLPGAMLEARKRGSLILLYYYNSDPQWWKEAREKAERTPTVKAELQERLVLKEQEKRTFGDPGLQAKLREFTVLKLDASEHRDPWEQYGLESFPATLVLDKRGEVIATRPGYMTVEEYVEFLDAAQQKAAGSSVPVLSSLEDAGVTAITEAETPRRWHDSLSEAMAEAERRKTLILVEVYGRGCPFCEKLEKETLADEGVRARLEEFTLLKLDAGQDPEVGKRYGLAGVPTSLVLDAKGELIAARPGFLPPQHYLRFLEHAAKKKE